METLEVAGDTIIVVAYDLSKTVGLAVYSFCE